MSDQRQGFMKIYHWVLDELQGDCKALGVYVYLLSKQWAGREPFEYKVNDRTYKILAGQHMTSYRRLKFRLKSDISTIKKNIAKLVKISAIQCETNKDGIIITFLTPVVITHTPYRELDIDPVEKTPDTLSRTRTLNNNYLTSNNYLKEDLNARARVSERASIETYDYSDSESYSSEDRKNTPPEPLDDPSDTRFNLDQRYDPRVRQSVWRQLAVDWYYWASENGKVRMFVFTNFVDSVRAMIDSGQVDELTLKEMFEKVVKVNIFWKRQFKQITKWNDYFQTGETRLTACLSDLKQLNEKNKSDKNSKLMTSWDHDECEKKKQLDAWCSQK